MKRPIIIALATVVLLAGCGGATGPAPSGPPAYGAPGRASATPGAAAAGTGDLSAQFGGDVCSALTKADVEGASYTQGTAVFDSTDTQKDEDTGQAVVCQYLVTFGGGISVVGVSVSLMDATEFAGHADASLMAPEEKLSGIGTEAFLVAPAPGLYEVWVNGAHGYFKVGGQSKESDIALATTAAGRN